MHDVHGCTCSRGNFAESGHGSVWKCLEVSVKLSVSWEFLRVFLAVNSLFALVIEWVFLSDCGIVLPDSWTSLFGRGGGCNEHA